MTPLMGLVVMILFMVDIGSRVNDAVAKNDLLNAIIFGRIKIIVDAQLLRAAVNNNDQIGNRITCLIIARAK